jgi:lysozyme
MKNISLLIAFGLAIYFLLVRKAGATYADSGGADIGNPLYFSLGKIMTDGQTLSYDGLQKLKRREAFSSVPYNDPPGSNNWSIGYGHQIKASESFTQVDSFMAEQLLAADVQDAEDAVNSNVSATLTQVQFDALVSFVYNVGGGAFARGSIPEKLNAGNFDAALATMRLYIKAGGTVSASLISRRADEIGQFLA